MWRARRRPFGRAFARGKRIRYIWGNMVVHKGRPPAERESAPGVPKKARDSKPLLTTAQRIFSKNIIFETMMRAGDAFGRPFSLGVASLTGGLVKKLRQRGFFGFETYERVAQAAKNRDPEVNKFTRYGAAPFRGKLRRPTENR